MAAYLPNWNPAVHTHRRYPFWSPLVVSSMWSRFSRGCCPPDLPVSASRNPCSRRRGQPLKQRSTGEAPEEPLCPPPTVRQIGILLCLQFKRDCSIPPLSSLLIHLSAHCPAVEKQKQRPRSAWPLVARRVIASGGRFLKKCPIDVAAGQKRGEEERWERKKSFHTIKLARTTTSTSDFKIKYWGAPCNLSFNFCLTHFVFWCVRDVFFRDIVHFILSHCTVTQSYCELYINFGHSYVVCVMFILQTFLLKW